MTARRRVAGSVLLALAVAGGPAPAADWSFDPSVVLGVQYNDNVLLVTDVESGSVQTLGDWIGILSVALPVTATTPRSSTNLTFTPTRYQYDDKTYTGPNTPEGGASLSDLSYTDYTASLGWTFTQSTRTSWEVTGSGTRTQRQGVSYDNIQQDLFVLPPTTTTSWTAWGSGTFRLSERAAWIVRARLDGHALPGQPRRRDRRPADHGGRHHHDRTRSGLRDAAHSPVPAPVRLHRAVHRQRFARLRPRAEPRRGLHLRQRRRGLGVHGPCRRGAPPDGGPGDPEHRAGGRVPPGLSALRHPPGAGSVRGRPGRDPGVHRLERRRRDGLGARGLRRAAPADQAGLALRPRAALLRPRAGSRRVPRHRRPSAAAPSSWPACRATGDSASGCSTTTRLRATRRIRPSSFPKARTRSTARS